MIEKKQILKYSGIKCQLDFYTPSNTKQKQIKLHANNSNDSKSEITWHK